MKIKLSELKQIITEELDKLNEEEAQDEPEGPEGLDPAMSGSPLKKSVQRLMDPDINPQRFAKLDKLMQQKGGDVDKAQAIAAFAINYANDGNINADDVGKVIQLLDKAKMQAKKILKSYQDEEEQTADSSSST